MKKVLIVFGVIIALLLAAMILIPIIFKDDIKKGIDDVIAENVDAQVYFDTNKFGLSFFSHFPSLTVKMEDFGVVNNAPFKGDTLVGIQRFELAINVMSLLGDKIELNGIYLIQPNINVKVLKNGKANYDIAKSSGEEEVEEEAPAEEGGEFSIGIKKWEIRNANIRYIDKSSDMEAAIIGLDHTGSGDFTQSVLDLATNTSIQSLDFSMEGADYLSNNSFNADLTMNLDLDNGVYTFKENVLQLNAFAFGFDGSITVADEYQDFDLTFGAKETSFKNILSLVPGIFMKDFEALETSGTLAFDGFAKGKMEGDALPDFGLNLVVNDGMFHYPDLPESVKNVALDLHIKKEGASLEAIEVDLNKFHMDMGKNPVDITAKTKGIENIDMLVDAMVKIDLADVSSIYPIEGLELKGLIDLKANVEGVYNENSLPNVKANLNMTQGFVKSSEVPVPIQNINVEASAMSQGGDMVNSRLDVNKFSMNMDGQPVEAFLHVQNFENYEYETGVKGRIDLGKIMKIFPQEGMDMSGIIAADIKTSGKMSDIEAEAYDKLPTEGNISIVQLAFKSEDLPQGMKINAANMTFNPQEMNLRNYNGTLGNSDMQMNGSIQNYLSYVMSGHTLKGNLNFNSNSFDLNEWMSEEGEEEVVVEESSDEEMVVTPIPRNIDFTLNANIKKIVYDPQINNMKGTIIIRDGVLKMQNSGFQMIGGTFVSNGEYDTRDSTNPSFNFDLDIKNIEIPKAYESFVAIQEMAPMAKNMTGNLSTNFHIDGKLLQDYSPDMATLSGGGLLNVFNAAMQDIKIINKLNSAASFAGLNAKSDNNYPLSDVLVNAEIRDGKVFFEPFTVNAGGNDLTIGGNYGLDGALDYTIKSKVQASAITGAAASALNSFAGTSMSGKGPVVMNFGVGGTQDDPQVKLLGVESEGGSPTNVAKQAVTNVTNNAKNEARKKAQAQADKILADAQKRADQIRRQGKIAADEIRKQSNKRADDLVKKASNPIAKRAAKEAAKKIKKEGEDKAKKTESEANKRADQVMAEARKQANKILNP